MSTVASRQASGKATASSATIGSSSPPLPEIPQHAHLDAPLGLVKLVGLDVEGSEVHKTIWEGLSSKQQRAPVLEYQLSDVETALPPRKSKVYPLPGFTELLTLA